MENNYENYKRAIKSILNNDNIDKILIGNIAVNIGDETCHEIMNSNDKKVFKFFEAFDKIDYPKKFDDFLSVTNGISDWIRLFLVDSVEAKNAKTKFTLLFRIFRIQNDDFVNSLMLDEVTLHRCFNDGLINDQLYDELKAYLSIKGEMNTKLKFFWNINLKGPDCLWKLLWIYHDTQTKFIPEYLPDLNRELERIPSKDEKKKKIQNYCDTILLEKIEKPEQNVEATYQDEDEDEEENAKDCSNSDFIVQLCEEITADQIDINSGDGPLQLRKYQMELVERGIKEGNTIICAPTGSGKTIVAVKIVEDHLNINKKGKVAFLTHQVTLAEQQANVFRKCLKRDVTFISGTSKSPNVPLTWNLEDDNIFVLTAEILKNNLELKTEYKLKSINEFSLIIFDECHNADKKHPFSQIMSHYFADKNKGLHVPKIIGLTASTGTNKAKSTVEALTHICKLCANLDACTVSTVQIHKIELDSTLSVPDDEILKPEQRSSDQFDKDLQISMALCERKLQEMFRNGCFKKSPEIQALIKFPEDRFEPKYLNILGKLDTDLYKNTIGEDNQKSVFIIAQYLKVFCNALKVNHLFREVDAINLIKEELCSSTDTSSNCDTEILLKTKLQELINSPEKYDKLSNPSLEMLKTQIEDQFLSLPDSRIIVFVRDRKHTLIMKDIFSSKLPSIKCEVAMGNEGLKKNAMQDIINKFTQGEIKVLFATTVIEEGQDIPKCNMVIRYGHVTNETSMIQSKGRARALNSKYRVIVPFKLRWQIRKENTNRKRAEIMYKAIEEFQKMDKAQKIKMIEDHQFERNIRDTENDLGRVSISNNLDDSPWEFYCKKCTKLICSSKDIRLAEKIHFLVVNQECYSSMKLPDTKSKNQCRILCANCNSKLGNRQNYKKMLFPNLSIDFFTVKRLGNGNYETFKRWKEISFKIDDFSIREIHGNFNMNHSLSDS